MAASFSQEEAQILFRDGAILVFLDIPEGAEFGIDYNSWQTGSNFRGVKMIPPGVHFIHYSSVSRGQSAPRTGFFYNFKKHELLVKKWDKLAEDIIPDNVGQEEQERFESNRENLDKYLGVYPYEKKWTSLTNYFIAEVIDQLQPINKKISSVPSFESLGSTSQSRRAAAEEKAKLGQIEDVDEYGLPAMKHIEGTQIRFTAIPKQNYPQGANAAQITHYSMDRTFALQSMLELKKQPNDILCEIQFAFVCFLIGHVYEAFEQWKSLINLLCCSEEACVKYPDLFSGLLSMLHYQIEEIPSDFFVDIVERENFLVVVLRSLFENLSQPGIHNALHTKALRFQKHLEKKFKWDFSIEQGEFAPVVVTE